MTTQLPGPQAFQQPSQGVTRPKAQGYGIKVGAKWFRLAPSSQVPVLIATRDTLANRVDTSASIYDNVLDIGYAWNRTDVSGGEGLDYDPREIALATDNVALDKIRYWDSNFLNNSDETKDGLRYRLRLANRLLPNAYTHSNLRDLGASDTLIYVAADNDVYWYDTWDAVAPISTAPIPTVITSMAVAPNNTVMVTDTAGDLYVKGPLSPTFTQVYNDTGASLLARGVWYESGRFIFAVWDDIEEAQLRAAEFENGAWTTTTIIDTASAPFWSVVESGPAIVSACGDGTVRTYTPDQDGTMALSPRGRTTVPQGETPILLGSNAGVLLILTVADLDAADRSLIRLYKAEVLDARFDYTVGQLQTKRQWTGTLHEGNTTRNMANTRNSILFFVREIIDGGENESIWRYDLVTGGLSRYGSNPDLDLNSIIYFNGLPGAIDFANNEVLVIDRAQFAPSGYMIYPNITFGLNTDISWAGITVEAENLIDAGPQIEVFRSADPEALSSPNHPSWVLTLRISGPGGVNQEVPLTGVKSRTLALMVKVYASAGGTKSPEVTRLALRGIPAARDIIMQVPFNVSDIVSAPGRKPVRIPGYGDQLHQEVLDLVGENVEVVLLDPPTLFSGVVNNIQEPTTYISARGSVSRYCLVEFRGGKSRTTTITATGNDGMGLGLLGIAMVGIGQTEHIEE